MGTTLTGTTPQDTYDSLIKVTDNGPLSGTAKYLSDGLGNDSALALSTSLVGVNTNTPSNFLQVTDPNSAIGGAQLTLEGRATGYGAGLIFSSRVDNASGALVPMGKITGDGEDSWTSTASTQDAYMRFYTAINGSLTEKMRITSAGNVGIGTASPASLLSVGGTAVYDLPASTANISTADTGKFQLRLTSSSFNTDGNWVGLGMGYHQGYLKTAIIARASDGSARGTLNFCINSSAGSDNASLSDTRVTVTANGLTFNGDTAAANALDDYEEGTFTPTFVPASGAYGTLTYGTTNGKYTKIGNRVDFSLRVTITGYSAGTASGLLRVQGLPFTCVASYVGSVSMSLVDDFAANRYPIKGFVNDTTSYMLLRYMTAFNTNEDYVGATDITASSNIRISGTYFTA